MKTVRRSESSILEYIITIRMKYPHLTEEQLILICKSPFRLIANTMKSDNLFNIRVKYLGSFVVYPGRVKGIQKKVDIAVSKSKIDQIMYNDITLRNTNYLKRNNNGKTSLD